MDVNLGVNVFKIQKENFLNLCCFLLNTLNQFESRPI